MTNRAKLSALLLALLLVLSLTACGSVSAEPAPESDETVRVAALKGPTAMGLVKLIGKENSYSFTLAGSADEVTPKLMQGELDVACIPANLASVLYQKTNGSIITLGINTLGVLYIAENGNTIRTIADLSGKTIVGSGKGSTPEYVLCYLLKQNGLDPDRDVTLDWKSEHSECVAALASGQADIALLPQPFVSVASEKIPGLRIALDLTKEWDSLGVDSTLITGVIAARRDFVQSNPEATATFLRDYSDSVAWVNENTAEAAQSIGALGIVDAAAAEKALPYCNIVCITGQACRTALEGYLKVLYDAAPASVGGALPDSDFYWNGEAK